MGSAVALGIANALPENTVAVSNPSVEKLKSLEQINPTIETTTSNVEAATGASVLIFAVKPWILPGVIKELRQCIEREMPIVVSMAGGIDLDNIEDMIGEGCRPATFYTIPNTAALVGESMTFISCRRADETQISVVCRLFEACGKVAVVEERLMSAATALSSCGIAYAYKYVQACVQAGVQMGFRPDDALQYTIATVAGAMSMLKTNCTKPQEEIDRVTTPGGMTIRGVNSLEDTGFMSSVINAVITPLKKQ